LNSAFARAGQRNRVYLLVSPARKALLRALSAFFGQFLSAASR
jgi:hypothetical protein